VIIRCIFTIVALIAISPLAAAAAERATTETGCWSLAANTQAPTVHSRATCPATAAGELRISVEGLWSADGVVLIGLYDSAESFDRAIKLSDKDGFLNDPDRAAGAALRIGPALRGGVTFGNLEPGRYAIIVIHDENANGRLDKNFFGVPTEPYGFSNHAQGFLGPPSFDDAAIVLDGRNDAAVVELIHNDDGFDASLDAAVVVPPPPGH
jgi:uncharacterized protein (DUF2141 family)